jgi:diguanylate cyclase (GGDEF)-like protein
MGHGSESDEVFRRIIAILLQAIEIHAVEGDAVDCQHFKFSIRHAADQFSDTTTADEALVMAGSVTATLCEYGERTTRYIRLQSAEYQHMVTMLAETIVAITQGSERGTNHLRDIEKQLKGASVIEDVRLLRLKLGECLESIQEQIEAQAYEAATTASRLTASIAESERRIQESALPVDCDPVSGVPGMRAAEAALFHAVQSGRHVYAAAVVPNSIQAINSRFGESAGDRVLARIRQELERHISAEDRVFRWQGPCFVLLLERGPSLDAVRAEMSRIVGAKIEDVTEVGARSILLPISLAWSIFPTSGAKLRDILLKINQFVTAKEGFKKDARA